MCPDHEVAAALPLGFVVVPILSPFLPVVLLFRVLRLLPWTIEARTYPWGRRFTDRVCGRRELDVSHGAGRGTSLLQR